MIQYLPKEIYGNTHKITVSVIGAGGTGSLLLQQLGRINTALIAQNKKGLHVRCFDHDTVEESNLGRQLFSQNDLGINKADVLISKINMFYGLQWESYPEKITSQSFHIRSNIIFICVDNVQARNDIYKISCSGKTTSHEFTNYYIIDCGNTFKTGQVFLSNGMGVSQPNSDHETISYIPNPFEKHGKGIYVLDEDDTPSCSLAQALGKQDLMINQFVANAASKMFWDMLQNLFISYNEVYVNLENGINIKNNKL